MYTEQIQTESRRPSIFSVTNLDIPSIHERDVISPVFPSYGTSQESAFDERNGPQSHHESKAHSRTTTAGDEENFLVGIIYIFLGLLISLKAIAPMLGRAASHDDLDGNLEEGIVCADGVEAPRQSSCELGAPWFERSSCSDYEQID